jgi:hypothetical protein
MVPMLVSDVAAMTIIAQSITLVAVGDASAIAAHAGTVPSITTAEAAATTTTETTRQWRP